MSGDAVATLGKLMVEPTAPPSTRVRAAEVIINHAAKAIEIEDMPSNAYIDTLRTGRTFLQRSVKCSLCTPPRAITDTKMIEEDTRPSTTRHASTGLAL